MSIGKLAGKNAYQLRAMVVLKEYILPEDKQTVPPALRHQQQKLPGKNLILLSPVRQDNQRRTPINCTLSDS